jgi:hypothetical protein
MQETHANVERESDERERERERERENDTWLGERERC